MPLPSKAPQKILLIRLDRIGDLVLTLPVDESLENTRAHWWIPPGLSFITNAASPRRDALEVARPIDFRRFLELLKRVREEHYDAAIVFHAPWWVSCLLWLARVPIRGGVRSQWHSFLFLNRAIRQKRSRAEHSELEYNYRLLEQILMRNEGALARKTLRLKALDGAEASAILNKFELQRGLFSVVHPGMGGSALNWPTEHYARLIENLSQKEKVTITGTAADEPYLAPLRALLKNNSQVVWLDGKLKGPELITVLAAARTITAPSTGVMHIAASTGQPTLGIFSPVRVQQPRRWGPQGERVKTIMPKINCPGTMSCLGNSCAHYNCMTTISVEEIAQALDT